MKSIIKYIFYVCLLLFLGVVFFKYYGYYEGKKLEDTSTLLLLPENDNSDNDEIIKDNNDAKNESKESTLEEEKVKITNASTNNQNKTTTNESTKTSTNNQNEVTTKESTKTSTNNQSKTTTKESTKTSTNNQNGVTTNESTKTSTNNQNGVTTNESTKTSTNNQNKTTTNESTKTSTDNQSKTTTKESTKTSTNNQNKTTTKESTKTSTNNQNGVTTNESTKTSTNNQSKTTKTNAAEKSQYNNSAKKDTVKINENRCYRDGATTILYYITECNSKTCSFTKKNNKVESGTVTRDKLTLSTDDCGSNKVVKDGDIIGATGFTAVNNKNYLKSEANNSSASISVLKVGEPFKILGTNDSDTWWKVEYNGKIGYVENAYCMINLPDYIPSIIYDIKDANSNMYTASGVKLSIYGKTLYKTGKVYNERLGREEYIAPVVYSFAKKILIAQRQAQSEGYLLEINDSYRPKHVADQLRDSLAQVYYSNSAARNGIDYSYENGRKIYWGQGWFIAQNLSSHSVGAAIDVVLVDKSTGKELPQQSSFYDLSTNAVKYNTPISGQTTVRTSLYSSKANKQTRDLDRIMLSTGMTNLASEWWHFQDNDAYRRIKSIEPNGLDFDPNRIVSTK